MFERVRHRIPGIVALCGLLAIAVSALVLGGQRQGALATHDMPCADIDGDTTVTFIDMDILASYFFQDVPPAPAAADMNGSGDITTADLAIAAGDLEMFTYCQDEPFTWKSGSPAKGTGSDDTDGDGCPDVNENGLMPNDGGDRDYLNPYDYFDPTGDGLVRAGDISFVVNRYFEAAFLDPPANTMPNPDYSTRADRTYVGPDWWDIDAPNGAIAALDIVLIVRQYFMDCP